MKDDAVRYIPIRRLIRRRVLIRWLIVALIGCAFVALYFIARRYCTPREQQLMVALSAAVYAYIVWKCRVFQMTFAREWTGTIVSCEVNRAVKPMKGVIRGFRYIVQGKWTVLRDPRPGQAPNDEDTVCLRYDTEEIGEGLYQVGDRVRLFANAPYMVKADPAPDDEELLCPLCSRPSRTTRCSRCYVDFSADPPKGV